jgi:hypothetical protein
MMRDFAIQLGYFTMRIYLLISGMVLTAGFIIFIEDGLTLKLNQLKRSKPRLAQMLHATYLVFAIAIALWITYYTFEIIFIR